MNLISYISLLPMSSKYTISTAHVQSVHHLYYPCPVRTPTLLAHIQSVPHLHSPYSDSTQYLKPMFSFSYAAHSLEMIALLIDLVSQDKESIWNLQLVNNAKRLSKILVMDLEISEIGQQIFDVVAIFIENSPRFS